MQALINELSKENLCTHFILPLLKLSKVSFTPSGFVDSYLTVDHRRIAVKVTEIVLLSRTIISHPEFIAIYKDGKGHYLIMFRILRRWERDVELFTQGKYSQLSEKAKDHIRRYSKLPFRKKEGNARNITDGRLLALDKHPALKGMWEEGLFSDTGKAKDDPGLHMPEEYLSIPGESSYINPEGLTRIRETQL